jgi:hypothetical protein
MGVDPRVFDDWTDEDFRELDKELNAVEPDDAA